MCTFLFDLCVVGLMQTAPYLYQLDLQDYHGNITSIEIIMPYMAEPEPQNLE